MSYLETVVKLIAQPRDLHVLKDTLPGFMCLSSITHTHCRMTAEF